MSDERHFTSVGKARRRVDGRAKVTGQTEFADDLTLPRMLHCKLLRSPHPHAKLESVDGSRALAAEGVVAVLTADEPVVKIENAGKALVFHPSVETRLLTLTVSGPCAFEYVARSEEGKIAFELKSSDRRALSWEARRSGSSMARSRARSSAPE